MYIQHKCICTCAKLQASASQLGRIVNKVIKSEQTKKSRSKGSVQNHSAVNIANVFISPKSTHKNRRVTALNKIFMKHITDLMATGEVASKLLGRGIEVTHVNVAADFNSINVYWIAQNNFDGQEDTENILKVSAGHLQHELSQLRVIGEVPTIHFVKNKQYSIVREVENRLAKVDFGEDFVPSSYIISKEMPILKTSLSDNVKQQIAALNNDADEKEEDENYKINIPEMRQDVLGFDHSAIMNRIKISVGKSKVAQENPIKIVPEHLVDNQVTSKEVLNFISSKENQVFDDFLKKRLADEKRKKRAKSLLEAKLESEEEWQNVLQNNEYNDLPINEEYRDEYRDIENYK